MLQDLAGPWGERKLFLIPLHQNDLNEITLLFFLISLPLKETGAPLQEQVDCDPLI